MVTACTAVEEPATRNLPIQITIELTAGQRVICENSSGRAGFPLATPSAAAVIFYQRLRIECFVVGQPPAPPKAKVPPK
jgi:hypothetical protein